MFRSKHSSTRTASLFPPPPQLPPEFSALPPTPLPPKDEVEWPPSPPDDEDARPMPSARLLPLLLLPTLPRVGLPYTTPDMLPPESPVDDGVPASELEVPRAEEAKW